MAKQSRARQAGPKEANEFQRRVTQRLAELRRNPFEAARLGGFKERGFVHDVVVLKKNSVTGENLKKLAIALECDVDYLLGRQDVAKATSSLYSPGVVSVSGEVAAGLWIDSSLDGAETFTLRPSPFPPDGRYPTLAQFDLVVRGTSIDRFAREGQILRCVTLDGYRRDLADNQLVIAERFRGDLRERTAKRWKMSKGRLELWPDSDDPRWQEPLIVDPETGDADGDLVKIFGVVLYVFATP
jgi:hypothetical protein